MTSKGCVKAIFDWRTAYVTGKDKNGWLRSSRPLSKLCAGSVHLLNHRQMWWLGSPPMLDHRHSSAQPPPSDSGLMVLSLVTEEVSAVGVEARAAWSSRRV